MGASQPRATLVFGFDVCRVAGMGVIHAKGALHRALLNRRKLLVASVKTHAKNVFSRLQRELRGNWRTTLHLLFSWEAIQVNFEPGCFQKQQSRSVPGAAL